MRAIDETSLADTLPGTWSIAATNFPMWLSGQRRQPRFSYVLLSQSPLIFSDDVSYTDAEGAERHILGQDTFKHNEFVWRGRGRLRFFASRWTICGISDDGTIAVVRFSKSIATPGGLDIVVREGVEHPELRALIAGSTVDYGLSPEDFGSLTWLYGTGRG